MRLFTAIIATLLAAAGLLAWVMSTHQPSTHAAPTATGRPLPQGGIYVQPAVEPRDLNPLTTTDAWAFQVIQFTHDCLMRLDSASGKLQPAVLKLIRAADDQRTFDFELREGVRFADGTPVTIEDIGFPFELASHEPVVLGSLAQPVGRVARFEPRGDRGCRFVLKSAHFTGLKGFATTYRVVKRQWFVDSVASLAQADGESVAGLDDAKFARYLSQVELPGPGTGPYRLAVDAEGAPAWDRGTELRLVQNLRSWHHEAYPKHWNLAGIRFRFLKGPQAKFTELGNGRIDWHMPMNMDVLLSENPQILEGYRRLDFDTPANGQFFCLWNHRRPHLTDVRVRRALTMLFDRQRIVSEVLGGKASVARCWFKSGSPDYSTDLDPIPFDTAGARELLAAAGYGEGQPKGRLEITIIGATQERFRRILKLAQPAFQNAGVSLNAQLMENAAALQRRGKGDFDGYMMYWRHSATGVDPFEFFHSEPDGAGKGPNRMCYANERVDELLTKARGEPDAAKRRAMFHEFNRIVHRDQPITFFAHPKSSMLLHKRFQAAEPLWKGVWPERFWVRPEDRLYDSVAPK